MIARLALAFFLAAGPAGPALAQLAAPPAEAKSAVVRLRVTPRTEKHIRERHFPGGRQTRGKSVFLPDTDLTALLAAAGAAPARRQTNGRFKRVVDAGKPIGTDGRTRRPVKTYVVISEPDGLVITAYPGV